MYQIDLSGKHALVTGGGTGIGRAIALALAEAGAKVTITGRRLEPLQEVAGHNPAIFPRVMDVTDEENVVHTITEAIASDGPIQICVPNAGIAETVPLRKMSLDFWHKIMRTNLDGVFLTIRECLNGMVDEGWGRVITISSIAGLKGLRYGAAYSASKHGVIGLTRVVAEEYVHEGVTANALCPGYVRTPIVERNMKLIAERSGITLEEALAAMVKYNRHGRLVEPEEVAEAAIMLCGPHSGSINGETIAIAGGQM